MRHWAILLLVACAGCSQSETPAYVGNSEQTVIAGAIATRPNGPVSDAADIITAEREALLEARLREIFDNTQTALIVATVESLHEQDVSTYTNSLAKTWEVGGARGGVVLLVAPNERQVRIETDDKVRARLSDEQCAEIIEKILLPRLGARDFGGGIRTGVEAIAAHL